jgi:hypothetical protein
VGVSYGHYLFGEDIALNPDDTEHNLDRFAHEFGHTYQSRISGNLYLLGYGISSAFISGWTEDDAEFRAERNLGPGLLQSRSTKIYAHAKWWAYLRWLLGF